MFVIKLDQKDLQELEENLYEKLKDRISKAENKEWLSVDEAIDFFKTEGLVRSKQTIYAYIHYEKIKYKKIGRNVVVKKSSLEELISSKTKEPKFMI